MRPSSLSRRQGHVTPALAPSTCSTDCLASSPDDSYPETAGLIADDINFFMDNFTAEEAEDPSRVRDLDAFRSFQLAAAYCFTCSEDSGAGDYDDTRECFMVKLADGQIDDAPGDDGNGGADAQAN